jgi:hypothetical protein
MRHPNNTYSLSIKQTAFLAVFIALGFAAQTQAADSTSATPKVSWKVSGELEEACSCNAPCGCWFTSLPSKMTCNGAQIIFISKGRYGKTPLDGLALAQFVQSPEGKSMFESFGNWNFDYVYIDEKANDEQRKALTELAKHFFPQAAKGREVRYVPISRKIDGQEHSITVGKYAVASGHLIDGGFAGAPVVMNPPLADPTHKQYKQGRTTKFTYNDAKQDWNYENSNYMFNKFSTSSKEYEKFEADMARKMAAMNSAEKK